MDGFFRVEVVNSLGTSIVWERLEPLSLAEVADELTRIAATVRGLADEEREDADDVGRACR